MNLQVSKSQLEEFIDWCFGAKSMDQAEHDDLWLGQDLGFGVVRVWGLGLRVEG